MGLLGYNRPMKKQDPTVTILSADHKGKLIQIGVEHIKSAYIVEGCSPLDLATRFNVPVKTVEMIIQDNGLDKLRAAHIKHGLSQLQSMQLVHAEKLMNLENQFKKIRLIQLEKTLEDYMVYYSKYGHFYKIHPLTGAVLNDTNGIPIQIKIPNVSQEISQLKEAVTLSEGLKNILSHIDDIINRPKDAENLDPNVIDMDNFNNLFQKKKDEDDD